MTDPDLTPPPRYLPARRASRSEVAAALAATRAHRLALVDTVMWAVAPVVMVAILVAGLCYCVDSLGEAFVWAVGEAHR